MNALSLILDLLKAIPALISIGKAIYDLAERKPEKLATLSTKLQGEVAKKAEEKKLASARRECGAFGGGDCGEHYGIDRLA